jgi:hypothetical protein
MIAGSSWALGSQPNQVQTHAAGMTNSSVIAVTDSNATTVLHHFGIHVI